MGAQPTVPPAVHGALVELSAALVIVQPIILTVTDWYGTPNYRPDAYERRELGQHIERYQAWALTHHQLAEWAKRTGKRQAGRSLRLAT